MSDPEALAYSLLGISAAHSMERKVCLSYMAADAVTAECQSKNTDPLEHKRSGAALTAEIVLPSGHDGQIHTDL